MDGGAHRIGQRLGWPESAHEERYAGVRSGGGVLRECVVNLGRRGTVKRRLVNIAYDAHYDAAIGTFSNRIFVREKSMSQCLIDQDHARGVAGIGFGEEAAATERD